jgi:hypothetical protein
MGGPRGMTAAVLLALVLTGCATVKIQETRVVTGRITDESGQPVANTPVLMVGRLLDLVTTRMEYQERGRKEIRTTTDAQGRYRLEFVPATLGNNFYLFFYDKTGFDSVKYRRAEPLDITALLDRDRESRLNQVLQFTPAWPEVERQIGFYGKDSERGMILRKFGLPEKREQTGGADDSQVWWYYTEGVSYWFIGGKLTKTQEFQPIPTPPSVR